MPCTGSIGPIGASLVTATYSVRWPIAAYVFRRVAARLPDGVALERVRIEEDPTLYADCTGID